MRSLLAALCLLPLSACTTLEGGPAGDLPAACRALGQAHIIFVTLSAAGQVPGRTVTREAAAFEGVRVLCAEPQSVTAADAVLRVAAAYAATMLALKEAGHP